MHSLIAYAAPLADTWSMHGGDVGFGWWLVMTLGMVALWGAVIALLVWLLRSRPSTRESPPPVPAGTPREILDRRLADGTLSVEEYTRRRELLDQAAARPAATGAGAPR